MSPRAPCLSPALRYIVSVFEISSLPYPTRLHNYTIRGFTGNFRVLTVGSNAPGS